MPHPLKLSTETISGDTFAGVTATGGNVAGVIVLTHTVTTLSVKAC